MENELRLGSKSPHLGQGHDDSDQDIWITHSCHHYVVLYIQKNQFKDKRLIKKLGDAC